MILIFFFFNDTATTEIYTLSLHDALPISYLENNIEKLKHRDASALDFLIPRNVAIDRKSTRLNSSHLVISYAVFCLKKRISYIDFLASFIAPFNMPRMIADASSASYH